MIDTDVCVNPVLMLDGVWGEKKNIVFVNLSSLHTHTQNGMYNVKIYI